MHNFKVKKQLSGDEQRFQFSPRARDNIGETAANEIEKGFNKVYSSLNELDFKLDQVESRLWRLVITLVICSSIIIIISAGLIVYATLMITL